MTKVIIFVILIFVQTKKIIYLFHAMAFQRQIKPNTVRKAKTLLIDTVIDKTGLTRGSIRNRIDFIIENNTVIALYKTRSHQVTAQLSMV